MKELRVPWLWLGLWLTFVGFVIAVSLGPPATVGPDVPASDKWMHLGTYFLLAAGAVQLFRTGRVLIGVAVALVLLGVGLEVAQGMLTDDRMMDWRDAIANGIGVLLGFGTARLRVGDALVRWVGRAPAPVD